MVNYTLSEFTKNLQENKLTIHDYFSEDSTRAKVYFLLLQKPLSVTEISKILYNGRIILSQISKIKEDLEKLNVIEQVNNRAMQELRGREITAGDLRKQYWKANYLPVIRYFEENIAERWGGKSNKNIFDDEQGRTLELILDSNWFKRVLLYQHFAKERDRVDIIKELEESRNTNGEVDNQLLRYPFTSMAKQMVDIASMAFGYARHTDFASKITCSDINKVDDFDAFVQEQYKKMKKNNVKFIKVTLEQAKKRLGSFNIRKHERGFDIKWFELLVREYDVIMQNYAPVFMPKILTEYLIRIERTPSTLFYFDEAINDEKARI